MLSLFSSHECKKQMISTVSSTSHHLFPCDFPFSSSCLLFLPLILFHSLFPKRLIFWFRIIFLFSINRRFQVKEVVHGGAKLVDWSCGCLFVCRQLWAACPTSLLSLKARLLFAHTDHDWMSDGSEPPTASCIWSKHLPSLIMSKLTCLASCHYPVSTSDYYAESLPPPPFFFTLMVSVL